jgi:hypothetical protein
LLNIKSGNETKEVVKKNITNSEIVSEDLDERDNSPAQLPGERGFERTFTRPSKKSLHEFSQVAHRKATLTDDKKKSLSSFSLPTVEPTKTGADGLPA